MMSRVAIGLAIFLLGSVGSVSAASWQPAAPQQDSPGEEPSVDPWSLPRVVGEARSQEEVDAWRLIEQATAAAEKAELASRFIENYPQSGLVPYAHHAVAQHLYAIGNVAGFVSHAERAVDELPDAVDLLSQLAYVHAESGRADMAMDRATRALEAVDRVQPPVGAPAEAWVGQVFQVKAEANYALGRAHLSKLSRAENRDQDPNLKKAIDFLETALRFDPRHDYASFRLGYAERNANEVGGALSAYARAVAIGGVAAGPAQQQLEEVLAIVKQTLPESEWGGKTAQELVAEAGLKIQREVSRVRAEQEREAELLRQRERFESQPDFPAPTDP